MCIQGGVIEPLRSSPYAALNVIILHYMRRGSLSGLLWGPAQSAALSQVVCEYEAERE